MVPLFVHELPLACAERVVGCVLRSGVCALLSAAVSLLQLHGGVAIARFDELDLRCSSGVASALEVSQRDSLEGIGLAKAICDAASADTNAERLIARMDALQIHVRPRSSLP